MEVGGPNPGVLGPAVLGEKAEGTMQELLPLGVRVQTGAGAVAHLSPEWLHTADRTGPGPGQAQRESASPQTKGREGVRTHTCGLESRVSAVFIQACLWDLQSRAGAVLIRVHDPQSCAGVTRHTPVNWH